MNGGNFSIDAIAHVETSSETAFNNVDDVMQRAFCGARTHNLIMNSPNVVDSRHIAVAAVNDDEECVEKREKK